MTALTVEQLYAQQIRSRSPQERLRLLKLMMSDLTEKDVADDKPKRSLLELEGLGANDPIGMEAQEYVNQLRDEWDHRP
ncbi:MAG TPA: hypothetical protein VIL85_18845 [Thermomicrobiales bacterium]